MASRLLSKRLVALALGVGAMLPITVVTSTAASETPNQLFVVTRTEGFVGLPFQVAVYFHDPSFLEFDTTTNGTVTLALKSSPVPDATLACAGGLSKTSSGGAAVFKDCTIDRVGQGFVLVATASSVVSSFVPTPILAPGESLPIQIGPAIEGLQESIKVTFTDSSEYPATIWGDTVTVRVEFTVNGAHRFFQLQQTTRAMTTWSRLADLQTNAVGVATFSYRPSVSTRFRAVWPGAPDLPSGISEPRGFLLYSVAKQAPVHATPRIIRSGSTVTFTTVARPILPDLPPARVQFRIYHRVSGTWRLASSRAVVVDANGIARLPLKFGARGEWYVRSLVEARWFPDTEFSAPATVWASRPTPIARYSVR
jgi:hypothetical protein